MYRSIVVLPKTPAAKRHRKPAATKHSRTLRSSTTHRDSIDSGVELEMTKKPQAGHLDIVREKSDDEQTTTVALATSSNSVPRLSRTVAEARLKTEENKENIENGKHASDDVKELNAESKSEKDQQKDDQQTAKLVSSPASVDSTRVSLAYLFTIL